MKKICLILFLAIFGIVSCTEKEIVRTQENHETNVIKFSSYNGAVKGNPVDNNNEFMSSGNSFGVTAFISTSDNPYMGSGSVGSKITSNGTLWNYANSGDLRYWPTNNETLDFYAYAPYEDVNMSNLTFSKTNGIQFSYTVPQAEANQVDLMFASNIGVVKPTGSNKVTLQFKHALTQVLFKAATKVTGLQVDIAQNGITINNIKNSGTFSIPTTGNGWVLDNSTTSYTITNSEITGIDYVGDAGNEFTQIGDNNNVLMLLPQTFSAATPPSTTECYLSISCKIYQVIGEDRVYLFGSDTSYDTLTIGISSKNGTNEVWNRSKRVTYNILFGGGPDSAPIEFETEVEEWTNVEGGTISIS
jgi:hypothetical protein